MASAKKQILLVDDEKLIRFSLLAALENDSVTIATAASGADALVRAAALDNCRLCVVDLYLPDMNGIELIRQLKAIHPGASFIIITGKYRTKNDFLQHEKEAAGLGPFSFIPKPFDFPLTQQLVNEALAGGTPAANE
ncbi:MAG: response regulator [Thermodesulfobacteriota bacterium]